KAQQLVHPGLYIGKSGYVSRLIAFDGVKESVIAMVDDSDMSIAGSQRCTPPANNISRLRLLFRFARETPALAFQLVEYIACACRVVKRHIAAVATHGLEKTPAYKSSAPRV